jgi:hypothetical protein
MTNTQRFPSKTGENGVKKTGQTMEIAMMSKKGDLTTNLAGI